MKKLIAVYLGILLLFCCTKKTDNKQNLLLLAGLWAVSQPVTPPIRIVSNCTIQANNYTVSNPGSSSSTSGATSYTWNQNRTTYSNLSGSTSILASQSFAGQNVNLPFNFNFAGTSYTTSDCLQITTQGYVRFVSSCSIVSVSSTISDLFSSTASSAPSVLAPWWMNSFNDTSSTIEYLTSGSSPNRTFTVQWKNYPASGTTTTLGARFNFQVKIYETTNAVEFIYGSKNITVNSASSYPSVSASVGIRDSSAGFREGKTGSSSTGVSNYRVGDFPPSGVIYRFDTSSSGTTSTLTDMLFPNQWHLYNYGQFGGTPGEDLNVLNVWNSNKGDGTCIVAVDDGMDINHPDISPNVLSGASVNYAISSSKGPNDPSGSGANHGTCVSGLFGARDSNAIGVRGVAPRASIFSYNVLQNGTSANIGDAMSRGAFHVSNNSWGAPDGTGLLIADFADSSWVEGLRQGTSGQRNGKGAVYTWAAGNGSGLCSSSYVIDNSNYDAQANYYQVVAVAASGDNGKQACYSEKGANLWITAPSQGQIYGSSAVTAVTTTDNSSTYGYNTSTASNSVNYSDYVDLGYTDTFNGTSSTAPMIAGVASLILKANPNLTWRDVKLILAETARKNDPTDSDWDTTGNKVALSGKYNFNHKYGFGVADANAATTLASNWTSVGGSSSLIQCDSPISSPNAYIPDNNSSGISNTINFTNCSIKSIEFVEIYISIYHTYYGDLQISLNSPLGKTSILSEAHTCYDEDGNLAGCGDFPSPWRFGSAKHLGESSTGNWTISVKDLVNGDTGQLQFWWVRIRGR